MEQTVLIQLAGILVLGVVAQWLSWALKTPSIVLLLLVGVVAGPITGFLRPNDLFGDILLPFVSLCVGVILYEGGLSLRFRELNDLGGVFVRLITVGVVISWAVGAIGAHYLLGLDWPVATLLGAILVVTGPTVIGPILRQVRVHGPVGRLLKWEGIVIDPVGAMLAVLVVTAIESTSVRHGATMVATDLGYLLLSGVGFGVGAAVALIYVLGKHRVPDYLHNPVSLMLMAVSFTAATAAQHESGLLAATVMGIVVGNQKRVPIRHLLEFKETITVLLISVLFIILAARLEMEQLRSLGLPEIAFVLVMMVIARPLSVWLSAVGSSLAARERAFLAAMAPRGIVAAAVVSVFAIGLAERGYPGAERMVPATFLLVFITVLGYGIAGRPLAHRLGLAKENPQGFVFVGAHDWALELARTLSSIGLPILLIDRNRDNTRKARMAGLNTQTADALDEHLLDALDLSQYARLVALTPNDELNSLICLRYADEFGRNEVYQLPFSSDRGAREGVSIDHRGRFFPDGETTYSRLSEMFRNGAKVKVNTLTPQFDFEALLHSNGMVVPLLVVRQDGSVAPFTDQSRPGTDEGDRVVSVVLASPLVTGGAGQAPDKHEGAEPEGAADATVDT